MIIGVPNEIKEMENRVGATPAGVNELTRNGNQVLVEAGAGAGSGFADEAYRDAGATITNNVREVWGAKMVYNCLLYTSPSPRDRQKSRMPSSA